jgi:hypothetical protein
MSYTGDLPRLTCILLNFRTLFIRSNQRHKLYIIQNNFNDVDQCGTSKITHILLLLYD